MLQEKQIKNLHTAFRRIFTMPITRSTFCEIQNTLSTALDGNVPLANAFFESLLSGEAKKDLVKGGDEKSLKDFIEQFAIPTRAAREVFENGEFINLITSDVITRQNRMAYLTQVRRVDGQDFHFLTDPEGTLNIVQHFLGRLVELKRNAQTQKAFEQYKDRLETIEKNVKDLID